MVVQWPCDYRHFSDDRGDLHSEPVFGADFSHLPDFCEMTSLSYSFVVIEVVTWFSRLTLCISTGRQHKLCTQNLLVEANCDVQEK